MLDLRASGDATDASKIIGQLADRIPVVTAEEQQAAKDRTERIARGEIEPGMTYEEIIASLRARGWTTRDIRHMHRAGELHRVAGRIGRQLEVECEIAAAAAKAAERAIWSTTRLLLLGVKAIERDAINNVVAAEAAEGRDVTPEEVRASLELARIADEAQIAAMAEEQYEAETAEALAAALKTG